MLWFSAYERFTSGEINKAKELGKKLVAVKLDWSYESPTALLNSGAKWANFSKDSIIIMANVVGASFCLRGARNYLKASSLLKEMNKKK